MVKIRTPKNKMHYYIAITCTGTRATFAEITKEGRFLSKKQLFTWDQLMRLGKVVKT